MAMDQFLAQLYGTQEKTASAYEPSQEDIEKQAHVDLFIQTATQQGIDLQALPQEKVAELFDGFTSNLQAGAGADSDAVARYEYEKAASAQAEYQEKFAEWDHAGRVMAHAYVQEVGNIANAGEKVAGARWDKVKGHMGRAKELLTGSQRNIMRMGPHLEGEEAQKAIRTEARKVLGARAAAAAVPLAVGGGAYAAHRHHKNKNSADALDKTSADYALSFVDHCNKTAGTNFDLEECAQKLAAVLTLGPGPSEKVASAYNYEQARHVRGLELLEMAGYPIDWT